MGEEGVQGLPGRLLGGGEGRVPGVFGSRQLRRGDGTQKGELKRGQ